MEDISNYTVSQSSWVRIKNAESELLEFLLLVICNLHFVLP